MDDGRAHCHPPRSTDAMSVTLVAAWTMCINGDGLWQRADTSVSASSEDKFG